MDQGVTNSLAAGALIVNAQSPARKAEALDDQPSLVTDPVSAFLVQATKLLAQSLDIETTLAKAARLTVPHLGSWCMVDLCEPAHMRRIAIICADPAMQALADRLLVTWPPQRNDPLGVPSVVRTRKSVYTYPVTDELLAKAARTPENLTILRALQMGSFLTIPLMARGQVLGAITYVTSDHADPLSEHHLALAEDFALRCAIAIDNSRLIQEAKDARAHAEEANVVKVRFLATMSHELRTPLNAIAGYAEILMTGLRGTLTEEQLEDVTRIQANQRLLLRLVESVLSYAKLDAGRIEFGQEDVPVAAVISEVERVVAPLAEARGIACLRRRPEGMRDLVVHADQTKLQQILINLAGNAIKFSRAGGSIEISYRPIGDRVQISVTDDGIGIAAEHLKRIFEPFVQLDNSSTRSEGGTGLGLTISQELAVGMGGVLSVDSVLGEGSTFTLTLSRGRG